MEASHESYATHPIFRHVFREAVSQWLQPDVPATVSPIAFPQDARRLIQSQNAIGWRQILRGCFSHEWQNIQNNYYMKHKAKSKYNGSQWQKQFITMIWEQWFQLWAIRNGEVHGTTTMLRAHAQRREMARQVTEIYASREFMEPEAQALTNK